jgi:uncharacterized protein YkwD
MCTRLHGKDPCPLRFAATCSSLSSTAIPLRKVVRMSRNPVSLLMAVALLLGGCVTVSNTTPGVQVLTGLGEWPASATCPAPAGLAAQTAGILAQVNAARAAAGLQTVQANARVTAAAQKHACDVAASGKLSHTGSDGSSLTARLGREGILGVAAIENAGSGYPTAAATMAGWLASPGHRANLLNPRVTRLGAGVADDAQGRRVWILVMVQ